MPPPRKQPVREAPRLGPFHELIDAWLEADKTAPVKQRHTARRIWQRLVAEHGAEVSERQVCRYVCRRKRELGLVGEVFVPQRHDAGAEGEIDWFDAHAVIGDALTLVHLFVLRACHSGAEFAMAFSRQTQQAFLALSQSRWEALDRRQPSVRLTSLRTSHGRL